jgi:RNase adapter protein RapZ
MRIVIVSGMSGSGKSVALKMLEDLGWFCADNIPAALVDSFVSLGLHVDEAFYDRSAIGIDARNNTQDLSKIPTLVNDLKRQGVDCTLVFLRSNDSVLLERFSQTRRRHPLHDPTLSLSDAINKERALLDPIAFAADLVIDTTEMSVHELRELVRQRIEPRGHNVLSILFQSFGFRDGLPRGADFVFDARTLPNPYWHPALASLTGRDQPVIEFFQRQPAVEAFLTDTIHYLEQRIPLYKQTNRAYLTVAIGCTGGQHRSVYLAEQCRNHFAKAHPVVLCRHDSLKR